MAVVLDLFPAEVALPGGTFRGVRAVATDTRLYVVARDGVRHQIVLDAGIADWQPKPGRVYDVQLDDGSDCQVRRGSGCGCGSPLKRLNVSQIVPA